MFTFLQREITPQLGYADEYNPDLLATLYCKPLSFASHVAAMGARGILNSQAASFVNMRDEGCLGGSHGNKTREGHGNSPSFSCSLRALQTHCITDCKYNKNTCITQVHKKPFEKNISI